MYLDIAVPLIVVLLMIAAGSDVRLAEFRALLASPAMLLATSVAQVLMLPAIAVGLIWLLDAGPVLAIGLILIAASPGGALSNAYCYFGRLNVSLSVALTTLSSLFSFVSLPLALLIALDSIDLYGEAVVPFSALAAQLLFLLVLPVLVGATLRHYLPGLVERARPLLRATSAVLIGLLVALILIEHWTLLGDMLSEAIVLAVLFTLCTATIGWIVAALLQRSPGDRLVFAIEFAIRNLGGAALVALASFDRPDFVVFGAVFVLVQLPMVWGLLAARRFRSTAKRARAVRVR
jgi:BASS family bile acid:Na+ symporter